MHQNLFRQLALSQRRTLTVIARKLPTAGIFCVGGTVRDLLLGRPVEDIDIVITGLTLRRIKQRLGSLGTLHAIGARFGTLRLMLPKHAGHIDIALPRTEQAAGTGGYRDFSFAPRPTLPIEKDLSRRDFTVNAMALNWRTGELVDPHGGQRDCQRKLLRTVGDPDLRFREDYSRLLRLLRLSVQLTFSIHPQTARSAKRFMPRLNARRDGSFIVPREVIAKELLRTFELSPVRAFDLADSFGVFRTLLPEVASMKECEQPREFHSEGDVFAHTRLALSALESRGWRTAFGSARPPLLTTVALLFHDVGKPQTKTVVRGRHERRIRFLGHDEVSARLARAAAERLNLASYEGRVPAGDLAWLVRYHLIATKENARVMRPATLVKYFSGERGARLLELVWADQSASLRPAGRPSLDGFRTVRRRLRAILGKGRTLRPPKPLVNGTDIKRALGIPEGPAIGTLLRRAYEWQLERPRRTKRQLLSALREYLKKTTR